MTAKQPTKMISRYRYGIIGCIVQAGDLKGARKWLKKADQQLHRHQLLDLLNSVFEELLKQRKMALADKFYDSISTENWNTTYAELRSEWLSKITNADERKRLAQKQKELDQERRRQLDELQEQQWKREQAAKAEALRLEEAERERLRQAAELRKQLEEQRKALLQIEVRKLKDQLRRSDEFLSADDYYRANCAQNMTRNEFKSELVSFVQAWFQRRNKSLDQNQLIIPDEEQALAIATGRKDTLVVARAGSGKTSTIVNRALFLNEHCRVASDEILLLAFNKAAANEIKKRLEHITGKTWPHVMTFHALAYAIVPLEAGESLVFNEKFANEGALDRIVTQIIDDRIRDPNPRFREMLRDLMLMRWTSNWEEIVQGGFDKRDRAELLEHRRSMVNETLRGDRVKSYGEKRIANCMFEHDIFYTYESAHHWDGRTYRPDFTLNNNKVVIEYFGLKGTVDYDNQRNEKRSYWQRRKNQGWRLIEVEPRDLKRDDFDAWFIGELVQHKVKVRQLSEDEIWQRSKRRAVDDFTKAVRGFITRARANDLSTKELETKRQNFVKNCNTSEFEARFLDQAVMLYSAYIDHLTATQNEDFNGLLARAIERISSKTTFERKSGAGDLAKLSFVFVDEYQDFSILFSRLLNSIRQINPGCRFFCVGDDWQAINGFAGADLEYFHRFESHFNDSQRLYIRTNYRSGALIVKSGNTLMQSQGGRQARPFTSKPGYIWRASLDAFQPRPTEREKMQKHPTPAIAIGRLIYSAKQINGGVAPNGIVLLARTKSGIEPLRKALAQCFGRQVLEHVQIRTTHSFKGLEGAMVVILDAKERSYPLIHPDWVLLRLFGDTLSNQIDAERRLFYVALTRAKTTLVLLTREQKESRFLSAVTDYKDLEWESLESPTGDSKFVVVKIGGGFSIKDRLKACGYRYNNVDWKHWSKAYLRENFHPKKTLRGESWLESADQIEVRIYHEDGRPIDRWEVVRGRLLGPYRIS